MFGESYMSNFAPITVLAKLLKLRLSVHSCPPSRDFCHAQCAGDRAYAADRLLILPNYQQMQKFRYPRP